MSRTIQNFSQEITESREVGTPISMTFVSSCKISPVSEFR